MMADNTTSATELVCFAVQAEPLTASKRFEHNSSYVTQLIADASGVRDIPQRRRSDRAGPLAAYSPAPAQSGRTRRIA